MNFRHLLTSTLTFISLSAGMPTNIHVQRIDGDTMLGAVMGAAMGDALGRVTEFIDTTKTIHDIYGPLGVTSFCGFKEYDWVTHPLTKQKIAAYTDDTVMSLLVFKLAAATLDADPQSTDTFIRALAPAFGELFGPAKYEIDPLYNIRAHGITNINASKKFSTVLSPYTSSFWNHGTTFEKFVPSVSPYTCQSGYHVLYMNIPLDWLKTRDPLVAKEGGCGSVMRSWPLGLFVLDHYGVKTHVDARIIAAAISQSALTHRHPMALAACAASAIGLSYAARRVKNGTRLRDRLSVETIVEAMIEVAQMFDPYEANYKTEAKKVEKAVEFSAKLIADDKLLTSDMIRYAFYMASKGETPEKILGTENKKQVNNFRSTRGFLLGWSADEAIAAAVYIFVRHPDDINAALTEAVNTPGDSDSIATLVGALVGARLGFNAMKEYYDWHMLENYTGLQETVREAVNNQERKRHLLILKEDSRAHQPAVILNQNEQNINNMESVVSK